MNRDEALEIISQEKHQNYVWFQRPENVVDCVAIYRDQDSWNVVNTDERAVIGAVRQFDNEAAALDLFIRRLRLSKLT